MYYYLGSKSITPANNTYKYKVVKQQIITCFQTTHIHLFWFNQPTHQIKMFANKKIYKFPKHVSHQTIQHHKCANKLNFTVHEIWIQGKCYSAVLTSHSFNKVLHRHKILLGSRPMKTTLDRKMMRMSAPENSCVCVCVCLSPFANHHLHTSFYFFSCASSFLL